MPDSLLAELLEVFSHYSSGRAGLLERRVAGQPRSADARRRGAGAQPRPGGFVRQVWRITPQAQELVRGIGQSLGSFAESVGRFAGLPRGDHRITPAGC